MDQQHEAYRQMQQQASQQHQQQHQHHHQQQQQQPGSHAPIAPNPNGLVMTNGQAIAHPGQGMLMGLMTNPALAAASAGSPLFPPAAIVTNPGAFFAMPDAFTSNGTSTSITSPAHGHMQPTSVQPQMMSQTAAMNGTATVYSDAMGNQVQHIRAGNQQVPKVQGSGTPGFGSGTIPGTQAGGSNSSMQVHMVASAAAEHAVAQSEESLNGKDKRKRRDLSAAERAKQNRDRNREHARSTRMRKKAYVQKLEELVEGLHAERTEEVRKRRVAIQHLAEMQNVRRAVIKSFLQFHANYERDERNWSTILEDKFWLKQPVTPYRSFRRSEIEQECRISRGVEAVIADAASIAVMVEGVGSRSVRWMQIKREDFFSREEERTGTKMMPRNIIRPNGRFQHAMSSLSSSSANSSNNGSSGEDSKKAKRGAAHAPVNPSSKNVSNSSQSTADGSRQNLVEHFHDYHAKPLPDPKLQDSERGSSSPSDDSPEESNSASDTKHISTDSSSGDDSAAAIKDTRPLKRQKHDVLEQSAQPPTAGAAAAAAAVVSGNGNLPQNIARKGGIAHNVRPVATKVPTDASRNGNARLSAAPAIALPPFAGLGKKVGATRPGTTVAHTNLPMEGNDVPGTGSQNQDQSDSKASSSNGGIEGRAVIISGDVETSSTSNSSNNRAQIRAYYHVNEDDMILMDDVLMCPFVFRTHEAVLCGALAECVMPGMLRARFSSRNKLISLEVNYDAMGFMQQLERASGSEMTAQIIPGSLEMAISPSPTEPRVITLAEPPFQIISVNESWTKLTKYTQVEVEGMELMKALEGDTTEDESPCVPYDLEDLRQGKCICSTRLHYDKEGEQYVDFICSYPLTNADDEITHLLHISKELPAIEDSMDLQDTVV